MTSFTAIGHLVNDLAPYEHLGGGVSYASVAAARLGYKASIITRCPPDHPYIRELENLGVTVHVLPSQNTITSFKNIYDDNGRRTQYVTQQQDSITIDDYKVIQNLIEQDSIILCAPVIGEVAMELFPKLATLGLLTVIAQGYFRKVEENGKVKQHPWIGFEDYLKFCSMTIFSDEDIAIDGQIDATLLASIKNACEIVVLTQGANGATVYQKNIILRTPAFPLEKNDLKDFTGAGDVFATAFIDEYTKKRDIKAAFLSAHLYAAFKIMGKSGIGIKSIPTKEELQSFVKNSKKANKFLNS